MFKYLFLSSIFAFGFSAAAEASCTATYRSDYAVVNNSGVVTTNLPGAIAYEYSGLASGKLDNFYTNADGVKLRIYQHWVYRNTFFILYFPSSDEDGSSHLKDNHLALNPEQLGFDIKSYMAPYLVSGSPQPSTLHWYPRSFYCRRNVYWVDFFSSSSSSFGDNFFINPFSIFRKPRTGCYAIRARLTMDVSSLYNADASFSWAKSLLSSSLSSLRTSYYYGNIASYYPFDNFGSIALSSGYSLFSPGFSLESLDFGYQLAFHNFTFPSSELYSEYISSFPLDDFFNNSSPLSVDDKGYEQAYSAASWTNPQCILRPSSVGGSLSDRFLSFLRGFF
jgi:hypothetical protein